MTVYNRRLAGRSNIHYGAESGAIDSLRESYAVKPVRERRNTMASVLLRCRDADMMGPVCDYITDSVSLDESVREMRVHAMTHNEPDISDDDVVTLENIVCKSAEDK